MAYGTKRTNRRLVVEALEGRLVLSGVPSSLMQTTPHLMSAEVQASVARRDPIPESRSIDVATFSFSWGARGSNPNPDDPFEPKGPGGPVIHLGSLASALTVPTSGTTAVPSLLSRGRPTESI
jgi:hypothetical protein